MGVGVATTLGDMVLKVQPEEARSIFLLEGIPSASLLFALPDIVSD